MLTTPKPEVRCVFCGGVGLHADSRACAPPAQPCAVTVRTADGVVIGSLDDWRRSANPVRPALHWRPGPSAMELAQFWLGEHLSVRPLQSILNACDLTYEFTPVTVIPGHVTSLDALGPDRHHDLVLFGSAAGRRTVVAIEAKADEAFGPTIRERLATACRDDEQRRRVRRRAASRGVADRISRLFHLVFGRDLSEADLDIRSELLYALAGTYLEARGRDADVAVLMIQEFVTPSTEEKRQKRNHDDLDAFVRVLSGRSMRGTQPLIGPLHLAGSEPRIPILIGKLASQLDDILVTSIDEVAGRASSVKIFVRCQDGGFQLPDGRPLPKIRDGAIGELTLDAGDLEDNAALRALQGERLVPFLPSGSALMVRVGSNGMPADLRRHAVEIRDFGSRSTWFVPIVVEQTVDLRLRATKLATLEPARCIIPSLGKKADSINHAYAIVSEAFEPWRRSRGGNVFREVFCRYRGGWVALDRLRSEPESQPSQELEERDGPRLE